tara:strand:- start:228 stop:1307 length:1080 start_codon:yes stop_codon:yes gene_type:complete
MKQVKPNIDLNDYFCLQPFTYSEFHRNAYSDTQYLCCPDWNDVNIKVSDNLQENWNSEAANSVRKGHLTGNFKGCNPESCPALNTLLNTGKQMTPIMHKKDFDPKLLNTKGPKRIKICSDNACNLKCPTCREEILPNTVEKTNRTKALLDSIERDYGVSLESVYTSGGGDPFYSNPMREWLQGMNKNTFPLLNEVILHTNGILFTPKVWEKMTRIHPHVKVVEISIDAACKDTYENKTRLGGKWDTLIKNLHYIKKLTTLDALMLDFVVQKDNYKEMEDFVKMGEEIFGDCSYQLQINFQRVWQWPSISDERFKKMCIWDTDHPEHQQFLVELKKIERYSQYGYGEGKTVVYHNLNDLL